MDPLDAVVHAQGRSSLIKRLNVQFFRRGGFEDMEMVLAMSPADSGTRISIEYD